MSPFIYLAAMAELLMCHYAPVGTELHVRLTTAVGSYGSKVGGPVKGILIAPVVVDGNTILAAGSVVGGEVTTVKRVGYGILHETASLGLDFNRITIPGEEPRTVATRLEQVDNGREKIGRDGRIHGVRTTSSIVYRMSGYLRTALQWEVHAAIASWFIKTLVVQVPEPEIYYPAGSELTLKLTQALLLPGAGEAEEGTPGLTQVERTSLEPVVEDLPERSYAVSNRPSDPVNVLFIGSRKELSRAFAAAGWAEPRPSSIRSCVRDLQALATLGGYKRAQMSAQFIHDKAPDLAWEKGLNDIAKRHHVRLWQLDETWHGRELWVGAATRDIDFAYFRPGQPFTHRVQQNIDQERDKIVNDLAFTTCVDTVDRLERPGMARLTMNSTGDAMTTDARLAVIRLNDCGAPRLSTESVDATPLAARGGKLQRFVRREILSMRSDLIRTNTYYRAYEGVRWIVAAIYRRAHRTPGPVAPPPALERAHNVALKPAS